MAKTIVGLYDDHETAEKVVNALTQQGVDRDNIHVETRGDLKASRLTSGRDSNTREITSALTKRGVPEEEALFYAEGVRRGGNLVVVEVADEHVQVVAEMMHRHRPVEMKRRRTSWEEQGFADYDEQASRYTEEEIRRERERYRAEAGTQEEMVPIVEEELRVGKRTIERGGVRIHSYVEEVPVEESVRLREEKVEVERHDVDRPVRDADHVFEDRTIEMRETAEEVVVDKETRVTGEVVIRKTAEEHEETVRDTVRHTEVEVEDLKGEVRETGARDFNAFRDTFRNHFRSSYGQTGQDYSLYEPAYQHGYTYATDARYRGRSYAEVEPEMQRSYEERHGRGTWEKVKDAVRHAFDSSRR